MAIEDQQRWDERYGSAPPATPGLPDCFEPFADIFGRCATGLELACGAGASSVWLATNGTQMAGYDISPVAIGHARTLAAAAGVSDRCIFETADFDDGLPAGSPVDLIFCNRFRDAALDTALVSRLRPGGILALSALSQVGAEPGRFRTAPGELTAAFGELELLDSFEGDGLAWVVAQRS